MGVREFVNEHRNATMGMVAALAVVSIGSIGLQLLHGRRGVLDKAPDTYFSNDDGKTFFAATGDNVPPFDYEGHEADRAYVFTCGGKKFVGYLERYNAEAHKTILATKHTTPGLQAYGRELKRPGDAKWTKSGDVNAAGAIADVKCPDGTGDPEPVEP